MANFQLHETNRCNCKVNDILLHGITVLSDNFTMSTASRLDDLLRTHFVLIPRPDSSPRVASGAIDISRDWEDESRGSEC